jgi:hypothetical protein
MSGFASLLDQFKQTTSRAAHDPPSTTSSVTSRKKSITHHAPATPVRRIFVACPLVETGGPEALHQLCHVINGGSYQYPSSEECVDQSSAVDEFGREIKCTGGNNNGSNKGTVTACMLYLEERRDSVQVVRGASRPQKYDLYDAPPAAVLPGEGDCISGARDGYCSDLVVWPEIWTKHMDALQTDIHRSDGKKYQSAIWWLSVDNNRGAFAPNDFRERVDVLHLVQSAYARQYVHSNIQKRQRGPLSKDQAKVLDLTEFIPYAKSLPFDDTAGQSAEEAASTMPSSQQTRDLDVVYNPIKGMHYTDEIIRRAGNKRAKSGVLDGTASANTLLRFHPIGKGEGGRERISGDEVVALLRRAKVVSFDDGFETMPNLAFLNHSLVEFSSIEPYTVH